MSPMIEARDVTYAFGETPALRGANLAVAAGEVVAVMGPSGSGKSTLLHCLAGILRSDSGEVRFDGTRIDTLGEADRSALRRDRFGFVFQFGQLVPELTAVENVALPLLLRGVRRTPALRAARGWFERLGLAGLEHRRSGELSGGQAQRVALARALAVEPTLLLLDEPLAALDARTRLDTRAELQRHLGAHAGATLLVTHDPLDALVLADRLVIVEQGRLVQEGDAATVTARPRTDYVARLVGLNLHRGRADGRSVTVGGLTLTAADSVHGDAFVAFPPAAVALHPGRPDGSPRNVWPATVTGVQRHGDNLRVQLAGPVAVAADVTPASAAHLRLRPGQQVWAAVKAAETRAYPA